MKNNETQILETAMQMKKNNELKNKQKLMRNIHKMSFECLFKSKDASLKNAIARSNSA